MKTMTYIYICDECGNEIAASNNIDSITCDVCNIKINTNPNQWSKNHSNFDRKNRKINHNQQAFYALIFVLFLIFSVRGCVRWQSRKSLEESRKNTTEMMNLLKDLEEKEDIVE